MWHAWLVDTRSGWRGADLLPLLGGSVDVSLNEIDQVSVQVPDEVLRRLDARWWSPWRACLVVGHSCPLAPEPVAWAGGPITDMPQPSTITVDGVGRAVDKLTAAGMRRILAYRHHTGGQDYRGDVEAVKHATTHWTGLSLGTIARDLVEASTRRTGGELPIAYPQPRETGLGAAGHERTYEGWNLANDDLDKLLTDLSEVEHGPDIMLRPRLDDNRVVWDMLTGTSAGVHLPQDRQLVWDATAPAGPITDLEVHTDATSMCTRVWATGAGEGAGTAMAVAQADDLLSVGWPLMETVVTSRSTEQVDTLAGHARGRLAAGAAPIVQVNVTVQADHPSSLLGTWHVGDRVQLVTPDHPALPAGTHLMTVISATADLASESVTVHLQPEEA